MWWRFVVPEMAQKLNPTPEKPPRWLCPHCFNVSFRYQDDGAVVCNNCSATIYPYPAEVA